MLLNILGEKKRKPVHKLAGYGANTYSIIIKHMRVSRVKLLFHAHPSGSDSEVSEKVLG